MYWGHRLGCFGARYNYRIIALSLIIGANEASPYLVLNCCFCLYNYYVFVCHDICFLYS